MTENDKMYMTMWFENGKLIDVRTYRNRGAANGLHTRWVKEAKLHKYGTQYVVSVAMDIGISPEYGIVVESRIMRDYSQGLGARRDLPPLY